MIYFVFPYFIASWKKLMLFPPWPANLQVFRFLKADVGAPVHTLPEGSGLLMQIYSIPSQRPALHSRDPRENSAKIPSDTLFVLL